MRKSKLREYIVEQFDDQLKKLTIKELKIIEKLIEQINNLEVLNDRNCKRK